MSEPQKTKQATIVKLKDQKKTDKLEMAMEIILSQAATIQSQAKVINALISEKSPSVNN